MKISLKSLATQPASASQPIAKNTGILNAKTGATDIRQGRITVIDSLRGFALLGILVIHAAGCFFMKSEHGQTVTLLDKVFNMLLSEIMSGKFNSIFNMLFGVSFYIMLSRAEAKGIDFRYRFEWRLAILILIGYFHRIILPNEALLPYGVIGLALVLFWKINKKWIFVFAILCLLIHPFAGEIANYFFPHAETAEVVHTSFLLYVQRNIQQLQNPLAVFFDANWFFKIFGLFLLGFYVAGSGFFEDIENKKRLYLKLTATALLLYVIFRIGAHYAADELITYSSYCLSATIVCGFIWLYTTQARRILGYMEPYGKMGLSNYIMQSVLGLLVFAPFFLGLNNLNTLSNVLIALVIYSAQAIFSIWWLRRFAYGPFEWLWRSATYFKRVPFLKR